MKHLNDKIITWLKHHNIDKLEPNKQYLKIVEEVGELARGLLKNDLEAIKDAIGDIYISFVGWLLQGDNVDSMFDLNDMLKYSENHKLEDYETLNYSFIKLVEFLSNIYLYDLFIVYILNIIAINNNLTLKECVSHAYNEIKDREIKIKNGVAVKND